MESLPYFEEVIAMLARGLRVLVCCKNGKHRILFGTRHTYVGMIVYLMAAPSFPSLSQRSSLLFASARLYLRTSDSFLGHALSFVFQCSECA